ncbi:MAG TPA: penicillin-binding protein, partial [Actinomycetota bacterium]|nr:penicillin-binding protein [Actinomycetota bacterium]
MIPPAIPILLALVITFGAVIVALLLVPLFGAAGLSVNAFRDRLDEAGVGKVRIPRFPERSVIYASDGSVLATVFLDENRRLVRLKNVAPVARQAVLAIED